MKRKMKYFLMGAGAVVAGFFAYALLKDEPISTVDAYQEDKDIPANMAATQQPKQEYINHKREVLRERAAARTAAAAAADSASDFTCERAVDSAEETPPIDTETPVSKTDGSESSMQDQQDTTGQSEKAEDNTDEETPEKEIGVFADKSDRENESDCATIEIGASESTEKDAKE